MIELSNTKRKLQAVIRGRISYVETTVNYADHVARFTRKEAKRGSRRYIKVRSMLQLIREAKEEVRSLRILLARIPENDFSEEEAKLFLEVYSKNKEEEDVK